MDTNLTLTYSCLHLMTLMPILDGKRSFKVLKLCCCQNKSYIVILSFKIKFSFRSGILKEVRGPKTKACPISFLQNHFHLWRHLSAKPHNTSTQASARAHTHTHAHTRYILLTSIYWAYFVPDTLLSL